MNVRNELYNGIKKENKDEIEYSKFYCCLDYEIKHSKKYTYFLV